MGYTTTTLTPRQREIKTLLDRGMGAREIANELGVSRNAVYQQIQRLRKNGILDSNYTPTGLPPREAQPGAELLARLVMDGSDGDATHVAGALALVEELRRTRDELDLIARRLSSIVPR